MKARMLSALGWLRRQLTQVPSEPTLRRASRRLSRFEALERREVLSSATFLPFATLPGQVTTAGQSAEVGLHFAAGQVVSTQSTSVMVGFYVEAASGSTATPVVSEVDGATGILTSVAIPKREHSTPSKSLYVTYLPVSPTASEDITVKVSEPGNQTGSFILEAFLPGDANGDGSVNNLDLGVVEAAYGTGAGQTNFNPAADFNVDGHVGCVDLRLTQMNQGAHVTYGTPVVVAATAPAPAPVAAPVVVATPVPVAAPVAVATPAPVAVVTPTVPAVVTAAAPVPVVQYVPVVTYAYPPTTGTVGVGASTPVTSPTPTYYYGQPVVQSPGSSSTSPTAPTYYYGQPVVTSATATIPAASTAPVYYYGQPVIQTSGTTVAVPTIAASPIVQAR